MFFHKLLTHDPGLEAQLCVGYRPWPEESSESIGFWIDPTDQLPIGIEIHVDDPSNQSPLESSRIWGDLVADVLKLATAIGHKGLGHGYTLLFGELQHDPNDKRVNQFPFTDVGRARLIETDSLLSPTLMDKGFYEELRHPREATPSAMEIQLLACEPSPEIGFWLWEFHLP